VTSTGEVVLEIQGYVAARAAGRGDELYVLSYPEGSIIPWIERIDPETGIGQIVYQMPPTPYRIGKPQFAELGSRGGFWIYDYTGDLLPPVSCYVLWRLDIPGGGAESVWDGCITVGGCSRRCCRSPWSRHAVWWRSPPSAVWGSRC
jgi:hypothetical protein